MFLFDILKYVPGEFTSEYPVITDGKSYITLAGKEFFVNGDGDLVTTKEKAAFTTSFYEDEEKYIGHIINNDGTIESKATEFSKSIWKDYLRGGTHTIEIHIPSKIQYVPETIKDAYKQAVEFFKGFYPQHKPKAIAGFSWIFSPQLEKVLPETSNILAVNRSMHILPSTGSFGADCRFVRQGSSLQKRMAVECEKGTEFHYAVMYTAIDEIDTFGKPIE
jgi:hypothetical protein